MYENLPRPCLDQNDDYEIETLPGFEEEVETKLGDLKIVPSVHPMDPLIGNTNQLFFSLFEEVVQLKGKHC